MNETPLDSKLRSILTKQLGNKKIFNAILAVQSGDKALDCSGAVGYLDHNGRIEMRADSPFFIASITKMYTAAVVMHLHEKSLLNLDNKICHYLPASLIDGIHNFKGVDYVNELTIVQLLNQTSGLADYFENKQRNGYSVLDKLIRHGDYGFNINDVMSIVGTELNPKFIPGIGKKAHYSDTNYQLLGAIIESVTNKPLEDVYDDIIFTPLELTNTYLFNTYSKDKKPQPAQMYYGNKPMYLPKTMSFFRADGGIVSNAQESIVFIRAFLNGILFPEHYLKEMQQWRRIFFPLEYGYGLMRFKLPRIFSPLRPSPELIGHSGASASFLFYCPDKDIYMAGTLNQIKERSRPFRLILDIVHQVKRISFYPPQPNGAL
ncbi:serine hydrolase domain-containing protein [Chloroflexota bacterium]